MAVRCLTVHHLGITRGNEEIVRHGRYAYGKALCYIQKAIYDPAEALASETLCATMILSIYEVEFNPLFLVSTRSDMMLTSPFQLFACTKVDSWMKHAEGVRKMMLLRGPESFQNDFDRAMLMAFKGMIVCTSFLTQRCLIYNKLVSCTFSKKIY